MTTLEEESLARSKARKQSMQIFIPILEALAVFLLIWGTGEFIGLVFSHTGWIAFFLVFLIPYTVVCIVLFFLYRALKHRHLKVRYHRLKVASAFLGIVLIAYGCIPSIAKILYTYHTDERVWTIVENKEITWCSPNCWNCRTDSNGYRNNSLPEENHANPVVALVGDSFTFGVGVDQDETASVQLEHLLKKTYSKLQVYNSAVPGLSLKTYPNLMELTKHRIDADLFVLLVNQGDFEDYDISVRLDLIHTNGMVRLLQAINLESLFQVFRKLILEEKYDERKADAIYKRLDRLISVIPAEKLLVVFDASPYEFGEWITHHPKVSWYAAYLDEKWQGAERLRFDHHWSARGNRTIAEILAFPILDMLDPNKPKPLRGELIYPEHSPVYRVKKAKKVISAFEAMDKAFPVADWKAAITSDKTCTLELSSGKTLKMNFFYCGPNAKWYYKINDHCFALDASSRLNDAEKAETDAFLDTLSQIIRKQENKTFPEP